MDSSQKLTVISLCSGYCGIEMGVEQAIGDSLVPLAYVERESFAVANLVSKMEASPPVIPPAPIWTDLKSFPAEIFRGCVSLIVGGYPCQPFSIAGLKEGTSDPRHLWPYIREIVRIIKPEFVFFENVENHIKIGLSTVLSDLEEDGYRTEWGIFSAEETGSPQQRKRVFILGKLEELANSEGFRIQGVRPEGEQVVYPYAGKKLPLRFSFGSGAFWPHPYISPPPTDGVPQYGWEPPRRISNKKGIESKMGRSLNGPSSGMDYAELQDSYASIGTSCDSSDSEVIMIGNGVVPAVACLAWKVLMAKMNKEETVDEEETLFGNLEE